MQRTYIGDLQSTEEGQEIRISGWIQEIRVLKNLIFIVVRDNTGLVQATVKRADLSNSEEIASLNRETVIEVQGNLNKKSVSKFGMEVSASQVSILNRSEAPLPLGVVDPVEADFDTRLNNRFLDVRKEEKSLIFRGESSILWGIRKFMKENGFIEVHTPKIVAAATEGGADLFGVKYFEKEAFLNQSPQLYKEILMSAGMDRVFEVGPAFRAEEHNTPRHLNEFTSIDIEMSFSNHNDAMHMLESAVESGVKNLLDELGEELAKKGIELKVPEVPFPRITYEECREYLKEKSIEVPFGEDFSTEHLRTLASKFDGFYFITEWPSSLRPFYTIPKEENPELTNSFDLQYREIELTSGAQRVHDPDMLKKRFLEKGLRVEDFDFYIRAFRYGMPPHAGWAIGLERLTMILLNLSNIREATLFPRDRTRITP